MPSCWNKMWDFAENSYEIIENLIVFAFANLDMSETRIFIYKIICTGPKYMYLLFKNGSKQNELGIPNIGYL